MNIAEIIINTCPTGFLMEYTKLTYEEIEGLTSEKEKEIMMDITKKMKISEAIAFIDKTIGRATLVSVIMTLMRASEGEDYFGIHYHQDHYYTYNNGPVQLSKLEVMKYLDKVFNGEAETIDKKAGMSLDKKILLMCGVTDKVADEILSLEPKVREMVKTNIVVAYSKGREDALKQMVMHNM